MERATKRPGDQVTLERAISGGGSWTTVIEDTREEEKAS